MPFSPYRQSNICFHCVHNFNFVSILIQNCSNSQLQNVMFKKNPNISKVTSNMQHKSLIYKDMKISNNNAGLI